MENEGLTHMGRRLGSERLTKEIQDIHDAGVRSGHQNWQNN